MTDLIIAGCGGHAAGQGGPDQGFPGQVGRQFRPDMGHLDRIGYKGERGEEEFHHQQQQA